MAEKDWILRYFAPLARTAGAAGLRDDTAEITQVSGPLIATVDAMAEQVHFFSDDPLDSVARKLVRVNVSDILASGARPHEALLTLGWPSEGRSEAELAAFAQAFGEELAAWEISLIGGDTVSAPGGIFLSLTLTGECFGPAPVRRQGAKAGDDVWVTGEIGAARRGYVWKTEGLGEERWLGALREPVLPPRSAAELVAAHASAAMDISDGFLGDASTLAAASGLAVEIDLDLVPVAGGSSSVEEALALTSWGDDYQILLTAPPEVAPVLSEADFKLTRIGRMKAGTGLTVLSCGKKVNLPETLAFEHGRDGSSVIRP